MSHLQENIDQHEQFIKTMGYKCKVKHTAKGEVKSIIIDDVELKAWKTTQKLLRLGFEVADNAYQAAKESEKKVKIFPAGGIQ